MGIEFQIKMKKILKMFHNNVNMVKTIKLYT